MQINKFKLTFDYEKIMDSFDIYEIPNVKYKNYTHHFKQIKDEMQEALSIIYVEYRVYILIKKNSILSSTKLDIKKQMIYNLGESKEFILFKLLVYATSIIKDKEVIFDADGLFYIVKPSKRIYETVLVNIKKGRDNSIYFTLNAKNFVKKTKDKKYNEKRDKYKDNRGVLVRLKKGEDAKSYFVKQKEFDGYNRSSVDFLQTDWTKKRATKIDVLIRFLKDIRKNLNGYLTIELEELAFKKFELKITSKRRNEEISNLIKEKLSFEKDGLVIEDFVKDNKSHKFIEDVKKIIKEEYNSIVTLKKMKISKSQFNLFITESKGGENDPYKDIKKLSKPTQNILLKNLEKATTVLPVLLKELVVKQDILNRKISIPNYQEADNMTFYYFKKEDKESKEEIYKMLLNRDSIDLQEVKNRESLFEEDEKRYIEKILFEANQQGSEAELIIKNNKGDINIITRTNYFPIPNIEHIAKEYEELEKPFYIDYEELFSLKDKVPDDRVKEYITFLDSIKNREKINLRVDVKNKKVKNYLANEFNVNLYKNLNRSRKKNTVLDVITGIKYFYINEREAYFVTGTKDISSSFPRSNIIRKIETIEGKLLLDELLVMMDEYFVKNKELTVLPYSLKYLREFREMIKIYNMKFKN